MALSLAERASIFEMLSAFWGAESASITNGYGIVLTLSDLNILTADINRRMDVIDLDATAVTKVQALVVKWDCIASEDVEIQAGNVGDISGVTYSTKSARARIRDVMHTYIPVMHMAQAVQRRKGPEEEAGCAFSMSR